MCADVFTNIPGLRTRALINYFKMALNVSTNLEGKVVREPRQV